LRIGASQYIGPIDGHNIASLVETMKIAKSMRKPVIIHTQTIKGKGYKEAEGVGKEHWHLELVHLICENG